MSEATNPTTKAAAPADDVAAAGATLYQTAFVPVFFAKLAQDYGIQPANREQAEKMLEIGTRLLALDRAAQVKQAAAGGDLLDYALAELDQALGATPDDRSDLSLAAELTHANPELLKAARLLAS